MKTLRDALLERQGTLASAAQAFLQQADQATQNYHQASGAKSMIDSMLNDLSPSILDMPFGTTAPAESVNVTGD